MSFEIVQNKTSTSESNYISEWDYDSSVEKMSMLILSWKNISIEILNELYKARTVLNSQGCRNDLSGMKVGWENYLNEIGLNKSTVNRWLKKYDYQNQVILNSGTDISESVVLPKELEGTSKSKLESTCQCPHCGYEW
jgi:hypothetical protein